MTSSRAQMQLGECDIAAIEFDCFSRDDIPRLLRGLQHIYTNDALRNEVFAILADVLPVRADGEECVSDLTGLRACRNGAFWSLGPCAWV
ncbi:hypothetical protein [Thiorhodovibrio litoralis]|uniref:hypothetical protein n=1 Tax=Thiorhodovibrio litoralis TaxID=2952932 RepID=UPI002B2618C3|nr:hypothetical protein [Thiorhodovibrio litoralis]